MRAERPRASFQSVRRRKCELLPPPLHPNPNTISDAVGVQKLRFWVLQIEMTGTRIKEACEILECADVKDGYGACVTDYFGGGARHTGV